MTGDVRTISIKGEAAEKYTGNRGRTRKQRGGETNLSNSPPGNPMGVNMRNVTRIANASNPFTARGGASSSSLPIPAPAPAPSPAPSPPAPATPAPVQPVASAEAKAPMQGGSSKAKLLLVPPKKKTRGVILAPAHSASASAATHEKAPASKKSNVKKSRKVRVHLSGMKKRLTKAKTIHTNSREKPISEIRRLLEEAKLVKPRTDGKSVPDSVLRDIYKDYMLLRTRVL
jgi:hypothetical protein